MHMILFYIIKYCDKISMNVMYFDQGCIRELNLFLKKPEIHFFALPNGKTQFLDWTMLLEKGRNAFSWLQSRHIREWNAIFF